MQGLERPDVVRLGGAPPDDEMSAALVELQDGDRVVECQRRHELPARFGRLDARAAGESAGGDAGEPRSHQLDHSPFMRLEGIAERRADDLEDAAHLARPQVDLRDIRRVDVATDEGDRARRIRALGELVQQLDHRPERTLERRPVLEIERAAELLGSAGGKAAPGARADGFAPGLQPVGTGSHEDRQGARENEVVECAACVVGDPLPLLVVDHVAPAVGQHARCAGVDHHETGAAEIAVEREPARCRLPVDGAGKLP